MNFPRVFGASCLGWFLAACLGQAAAAAPAPAPAKYLFLVEASAVTAPYAERVALVVADLIERGCGGRMQAGDLFSILPFNEQLDPVGYTRKVWEPSQSRPISNLAFLYLQKYKFEKKPRWDLVLALIQQAVREERDLHLYLVISGTQPLLGTPFDADINAVLREQADQWRERRGVGVIALVAERGRLVDWAVGAAEPPAPTRLVARMPEPPPAPKPAPVTPPPPAIVQTSAVPVLVTNAQTAATPPLPKPPQPHTNVVSQTKPPPPPPPKPPPVLPPKEEPAPQKPVIAEPKPPPRVLEPPQVSTTQTTAQAVPPPSVTPPKPTSPPTPAAPAKTPPSAVSTGTVAVIPPPERPLVVPTQTTQTVVKVTAAESSANPSPEATPSPSVTSTALVATIEETEKPAPPAASPAPPAQTVAVVPQSSPTPLWLMAAGVGLLGLAIWLAVVWHRRTRPAPAPSLITQSMERERRQSTPAGNKKSPGA